MSTSEPARSIPVKELIERYNRELMETYRKQSPPPSTSWLDAEFPLPDIARDRRRLAAEMPAQGSVSPPPENIPLPLTGSPAAPPPTAPPSIPRFPYTDGDLHGEVPIAPPPAPSAMPSADTAQTPPTPEKSPYEGYLRVFVYTGQTAEPLPGAHVTVSRELDDRTLLYANTVTDRDGLTSVIVLPSVDPAQTMQPGSVRPYIPYDIRVKADGFRTAIYEDVPVYGGNSVTQSAGMYPVIPSGDNSPLVFRSGGPTNL